MQRFAIAAVDPGLIIYLILAVIWAAAKISQLNRRARHGDSPPDGGEHGGPPPVNEEIRRILETLTGQKLDAPRAPPPPPPVERAASRPSRPAAQAKPQTPRANVPVHPRQQTAQGALASAAAKSTAFRRSTRRGPDASVIQAVRPVMEGESTVRPFSASSFQFAPTMSQRHISPSPLLAPLKNSQQFRRAILYKLILGPPKSLQP